jgi:uncharacterized membrane protein SpoIIM required for sporulation
VIVDLQRFVDRGQPHWQALDALLTHVERAPDAPLELADLTRLHALYERACCDLAELENTVYDPSLHASLERLVARAYSEVHAARTRRTRVAPVAWFLRTFPQAFRRHLRFFALACAVTAGGALFGSAALTLDPAARSVLLPFGHDKLDPSKRVAREEETSLQHTGGRNHFSALLLQNNARVSFFTLAAGITYGIGSAWLLFSNGAMLGGVIADYLAAGEGRFLAGWLLPHGTIEIPCILIAGQAGLLLGATLFGRRNRLRFGLRMRAVLPDLVALVGGATVLLAYAALVESFLSQYHRPALYPFKAAFGLAELLLLVFFLARSGLPSPTPNAQLPTPDS